MPLKFDWNPKKAQKNIEKHGVSFDEAATVFSDPLSMTYDDPDHSYEENRYIIIGLSSRSELLFVSHSESEDTIRIISARRLTRKERKQYEQCYV
ncbi:BrnT family toxin [Desulfatirhabdium butyrativorans]|uniref:BrnT family toxin n=1 Tax=Desulfatirhabdium butyrativorans TaxID=340467 RepID=UPI001B7FDBD9|nr:BrnT family toxin [Desulfatirhabdium butyrativorans]